MASPLLRGNSSIAAMNVIIGASICEVPGGIMAAFEPACRATALGSVPITDPRTACRLMLDYFPEIPAWPQLPRLSFRENMYVQFSEGLPGAVLADDTLRVDRARVD